MNVKSIPLFPSTGAQSAHEPVKIDPKALQQAFQPKGDNDGKVIFLRGGHRDGDGLGDENREAILTTTQPKGVAYHELAGMASDAKREIRAILMANTLDASGRGQHLIAHDGGFVQVHPGPSPRENEIGGIFDKVTAGKSCITRGDLDKIMRDIGYKPIPTPRLKQVQADLQTSFNDASVVKRGKDVVTKGKDVGEAVRAVLKNTASSMWGALTGRNTRQAYGGGSSLQEQGLLTSQAREESDYPRHAPAQKTLGNRVLLALAPNGVAVYSSMSKRSSVEVVHKQIEASDLPTKVKGELKAMCQSLLHGFKREAVVQGTVGTVKTGVALGSAVGGDPLGVIPKLLEAGAGELVNMAGEKLGEAAIEKALDMSLDEGSRQLVDQNASGESATDSRMAANQHGLRKGEMTADEWASALVRFCSDHPIDGLVSPEHQHQARQFAVEIVSCVHKKFSAKSELVAMAASHPIEAANEIFSRQQGVAQANERAKASQKLDKALA